MALPSISSSASSSAEGVNVVAVGVVRIGNGVVENNVEGTSLGIFVVVVVVVVVCVIVVVAVVVVVVVVVVVLIVTAAVAAAVERGSNVAPPQA